MNVDRMSAFESIIGFTSTEASTLYAENSEVLASLSYLNRLVIDRGLRHLKGKGKWIEKYSAEHMQIERSSKKEYEDFEMAKYRVGGPLD
jgi:hypothetical protein